MVGFKYSTMSVVEISIPGPQDGKFRALKTNCACAVAQSRHVQFATALHQHQDIAMLYKESHQQGNPYLSRHSRLQWRTAFCLLLIVSNNCTKWFTNDILLRNKYYARTPLLCPNIFLPIYEIILSCCTVQCYGDVFELILFWSFFNLRNNGTAMAAPLPAALPMASLPAAI